VGWEEGGSVDQAVVTGATAVAAGGGE